MDSVLQAVGALVAFGGGGVAIGFAVFKWFGVKWIEDRFSHQLSMLQHEQNKVLANMKVQIESTLSGALKMQDREFAVLPQLWMLILQSYAGTRSYTFPLEVIADVQKMNMEELNEHLADLDWHKSGKRVVRQAVGEKREEVYAKIRNQYKISAVRKDWFKANLYIKEQAILLPIELTRKFEVLQELLWKLIGKREIGIEARDFNMQHEAYIEFEKDVEPMIKAVEVAIRERLESHKVSAYR